MFRTFPISRQRNGVQFKSVFFAYFCLTVGIVGFENYLVYVRMPVFIMDGFSRFVSHTRKKCWRGQVKCFRLKAKVGGNGLFNLFFGFTIKE